MCGVFPDKHAELVERLILHEHGKKIPPIHLGIFGPKAMNERDSFFPCPGRIQYSVRSSICESVLLLFLEQSLFLASEEHFFHLL